jgi:hypothetical protein
VPNILIKAFERETTRSNLEAATRALDERRTEIITEISEEFDATVRRT